MVKIVVALLLMAGAAAAQSFDDAKKDPSKRAAYLDGLLGKLACTQGHKQAALKGFCILSEAKHAEKGCHCAKCAQDLIRAEYKAENREFFFEKEIKGVLGPVESGQLRLFPFYRDSAVSGTHEHAGILLVGDLFALKSEDEVRSLVEDYLSTYLKTREMGYKVEDRELDTFVPALKMISNTSLLHLDARSIQIEAILKGTRKVSEEFKQETLKQYLVSYQLFARQFAKEKKVYDDNNENTLQKEVVEYLDFIRQHIQKRLAAAGLEHKVVKQETFEYTLEAKK
jgi:hypothetical protein